MVIVNVNQGLNEGKPNHSALGMNFEVSVKWPLPHIPQGSDSEWLHAEACLQHHRHPSLFPIRISEKSRGRLLPLGCWCQHLLNTLLKGAKPLHPALLCLSLFLFLSLSCWRGLCIGCLQRHQTDGHTKGSEKNLLFFSPSFFFFFFYGDIKPLLYDSVLRVYFGMLN